MSGKSKAKSMGIEEGEGYMMRNGARRHQLPALLIMLVALVVATVVAIGVALDTGTAQAATPTRATIEATSFTVDYLQIGEAFAVCPGTKRALGGGVVQSGPPIDTGGEGQRAAGRDRVHYRDQRLRQSQAVVRGGRSRLSRVPQADLQGFRNLRVAALPSESGRT